MSSSQYINTFALISFDFENVKDSIRYEYFVERDTDQRTTALKAVPSNQMVLTESSEDEAQDALEARFWIFDNVAENRFEVIEVTEPFSDVDEQIYIGPFLTRHIAEDFISTHFSDD